MLRVKSWKPWLTSGDRKFPVNSVSGVENKYMVRISIRDQKKIHGISQTDIDLASSTRKVQKRAGAPALPIVVLVGVHKCRMESETNVMDTATLLDRQPRKSGGYYDHTALMSIRQVLTERSHERPMKARELTRGAKGRSAAVPLEIDFLGGNMWNIVQQ